MSIIEREQDETLREIQALPEIPEPKTREEIVCDAAALIDQRGLAQATIKDVEGRFCLAGAIGYSAVGDDDWLGVRAAERICNATYSEIYTVSDGFRYYPPPERWRKLTPTVRAVRLLGYMADGLSFAEAAAKSFRGGVVPTSR